MTLEPNEDLYRESLSNLWKQLYSTNQFVMPQRSYIFNLNYVAIKSNIIILKTTNEFFHIVGSTISTILILALTKTLQLVKRNKALSEKITVINSLQVSIIPICSVFILYTFMENALESESINWLTISSVVLIIFINLLFFYMFDRAREINQVKLENEVLKTQAEHFIRMEKQMALTFDKIRTTKHDLNHHLLFVKHKLEEADENSMGEVVGKINALLGEINEEALKEYTSNSIINRMLNYKLSQAKEKEINTEVKILLREKIEIVCCKIEIPNIAERKSPVLHH